MLGKYKTRSTLVQCYILEDGETIPNQWVFFLVPYIIRSVGHTHASFIGDCDENRLLINQQM